MRKLWMVFPALLLIAGMVMTGCGEDPAPKKTSGDVTWTVTADGAGDANNVGTADTTKITITFSATPPKALTGQKIEIEGPLVRGAMTGSGVVRDIEVTPNDSGYATVKIDLPGIKSGQELVSIWKKDAARKIGYTATPNGSSGAATTTTITLAFTEAVTGLAEGDITIAPVVGATGGAATKNGLTGSGTSYALAVLVSKEGKVTVKIDKTGIDATAKTIDVYLSAADASVIPEDGETASLKWRKLEIDPTDPDGDDAVTEENEAAGKGWITGQDFDDIVEATAYKGTYLRVYLDLSEYTDPIGYGAGALGNITGQDGKPSGSDNLGFNASVKGYMYVDITLKDLKKFYDVDDGEIFVNVWNGGKVRAILLYEPIPAVPEDVLPDGVTEFTLGNADGVPGKGMFASADLTALNNAKPGSYLELYGSDAPGAEYGFGRIVFGSGWANKGSEIKTPAGTAQGADFVAIVYVAQIKYAVGVLDYDVAQKWANGTIADQVGFNLYNSVYLTKLWLVEPDDGEDPPPPVPPEPPEFEVVGNLGDFTAFGGNEDTQKGWGSNGADDVVGPAIAEFKAAKYIVIKATEFESRDGVGGLQITFQGDHNSWAWREFSKISGDWTSFANAAGDITYVVLDLSQIDDWATVTASPSLTKVKVIIDGIDKLGTLLGAWLLADDPAYTKPGTAVNLATPTDDTKTYGYLVKEADFDWDLDEGGSTYVPTLSLRNLGPMNVTNDGEDLADSDQPGWAINGHNSLTTDLELSELAAATYLVLEMNGPGGNASGFGGIQIVLNGDGTSWDGKETDVVDGWQDFTRSGTYYMAIELATLTGWDDFIDGTGTNGYICIASWPFSDIAFEVGYLTDKTLDSSGATELDSGNGFVTSDASVFD